MVGEGNVGGFVCYGCGKKNVLNGFVNDMFNKVNFRMS